MAKAAIYRRIIALVLLVGQRACINELRADEDMAREAAAIVSVDDQSDDAPEYATLHTH